MAVKNKIDFDKTEIIFRDESGKQVELLHLTYDKIQSILFEKCTVKKLFKSIETEKISMVVRGRMTPLELFAYKENGFFEGYKEGLIKFAKENRISLRNTIPNS